MLDSLAVSSLSSEDSTDEMSISDCPSSQSDDCIDEMSTSESFHSFNSLELS